jgi:hypothetical protein
MLGARTYFPAGSGIPNSTGSLSPQYQQVARTLSGQGGVLSARESFSSGISFSNFQLNLGGGRQRWNFCPGVSLSYALSADTNAFVSACPFIVA